MPIWGAGIRPAPPGDDVDGHELRRPWPAAAGGVDLAERNAGFRVYCGAVVFGAYPELFAAIAASAGALTGLLFVAISVAPRRAPVSGLPIIQQVRAAAALLAFTNALAVSLFGLVPGTNVGYPAAVLGVIGILFTAAGIRSIMTSPATLHQQRWGQFGLITLLLLIFGVELACGIAVIVGPHRSEPVQLIGYALVTSLLVGIARAWELVGGVDTGIIASIAVLTGRAPGPPGTDGVAAPGAADITEAGDATGPEPDAHQPGGRGK